MKPQPQTFAERLRGIMSWALLAAGAICTGMAVSALLIIWRGGWPAGTEHQRIEIIGWALLGAMAGMGGVIASLAIGGPVGRFRGGVGRSGLDFEFDDKDEAPPAPATVTTTTVIAPPPPPASPASAQGEPRP